MMTAIDGMKVLSDALTLYGIADAYKESEIIFTTFLGVEKVALYRDNPCLSGYQVGVLEEVLKRRSRREPLQYIIGNVDFAGLVIEVGPGVLIPRPETEFMLQEAVKVVTRKTLPDNDQSLRILDLCTGSGCLALALAKTFPRAEVIGTDISEKALAYARRNAGINRVRNVTFMKGDLFRPVADMIFDIIVSNPPYIRKSDIERLQPEIRGWEPLEALDGGEDGLGFYWEILSSSREYLDREGAIILEVGDGAIREVTALAESLGFRSVSVTRDYSDIKRVLRLAMR
jgi:release factor glutamine methyltransferase